jgi:hypothetical protein
MICYILERKSKMSKYTIDLNYEITDQIVVDQLRDTWDTFKGDLGSNSSVFVWGDQEADDVEIQKHIDALELVLKCYSTPDQLKEMGLKDDA